VTVRIVSPRSETTDRADDAVRQVGVTSLGADSKVKLYAGFTSIPLERRWLETAIASLRG